MHNSLTQTQFIDRSILKHGYIYDYSKVVYKSTKDKVIITCKEHGDFLQLPSGHMVGKGCPKCGTIKGIGQITKSKEKFIEEANKIHDNKYNYDKINYINSKLKVKINCPVHGTFDQLPTNHLKGVGCYKCSLTTRGSGRLKRSFEKFLIQCKIVHGDKYDYSQVEYNSTFEDICIRCIEHNTFFYQRPTVHSSGATGCKQCIKSESKGEKSIRLWLDSNNIKFEREKTFKSCKLTVNGAMRFDFYLPDYNLLIEYDGEQHYKINSLWFGKNKEKEFKTIQSRDIFKNQWAKDNGYNLLRIPYFKFKNIDELLFKELQCLTL